MEDEMTEIKTHTFDGVYWTAVLPDYDGPPDPCGSGRSEQEAIEDLLEQLEAMKK